MRQPTNKQKTKIKSNIYNTQWLTKKNIAHKNMMKKKTDKKNLMWLRGQQVNNTYTHTYIHICRDK